MRAWDIWIATALFLLGGGCLVASVHTVPFGPLSGGMHTFIRVLCGVLLAVLPLAVIGILWRDFRRRRRGGVCHRCGTSLDVRWSFCPCCGAQVREERVSPGKEGDAGGSRS